MKQNIKKIIQYLFIAIIVIAIIYTEEIIKLIKKNEMTNHLEGFVSNTSSERNVVVPYEYNLANDNAYPKTVYEEALEKSFGSYQVLQCNMLPTKKQNDCTINDEPIIKYKFPVHIIKIVNGEHLAVFNDGRIYKKRILTDKMWQGPLKNSHPQREIPLRMITLNPAGDKLVGVGFDNKAYIKLKDPNSVVAMETVWKYIPGLDDVIWVGYVFDETNNYHKYITVNTAGRIQLSNTEDPIEGFIDASIIKEPVLKLYFDVNNYMMAIDTSFRLRTFEKEDWMISEFSKKYPANPIPVNDVIYDQDQMLFGVVILPKVGQCEVMKQEEPAFMSPFVPFELNSFLDSRLNRRITDRSIIKSKMGIFTKSGMMEEEALDNDINIAYQRQQIMDKKRLREFCLKRGIQTDVNYRNYELDKVIDENERKITKLENVIKELIKFDPDNKKIQEKAVGINFLSAGDLPDNTST